MDLKTPNEINMNAENAFLLREAAKAHADGYSDHLTYGGKGDPAEERWIEALSAGADALALIQQLQAENAEQAERIKQLEAERDAAVDDKRGDCTYCAYLPGETIPQTCFDCANKGYYRWQWRGVTKEDGNG